MQRHPKGAETEQKGCGGDADAKQESKCSERMKSPHLCKEKGTNANLRRECRKVSSDPHHAPQISLSENSVHTAPIHLKILTLGQVIGELPLGDRTCHRKY